MTIPFLVGQSRSIVPGVYSTFAVSSTVNSPAPGGRSVCFIGEGLEGAPASEINLGGNYFTSYDEVQEVYHSGPIVDAARQFFTNQPAQTATGSIFRFYAGKTNASIRAQKSIISPVNYGMLVSLVYGERGNSIRSQIKTAQIEVKPTLTVNYLASPAARSFKVAVNGVVSSALSVAAGGEADEFVTALAGVSGLSATGGTSRTTIVSGPMVLDVTAAADVITLTRSTGSATFSNTIQIGDSLEIAAGSTVAGTGNANAGDYIITAISTTSLSAKQLKAFNVSTEVNASVFDTSTALSTAAADLAINAPVVLTVTATTAAGGSASLEILENSADKLALGMIVKDAELSNILTNSTSTIANVSASVPSAGQLLVSLSTGSFSQTPKVGDLVRIARGSILAGATLKNVGLMVVTAASAQNITLAHLYSGMTTEAVASVSINGANDVLKYAPGFVSSSVAAKRIDSDSERKVVLDATRTSDGVSVPQLMIGGNVALEISYYNASATAATVSIDPTRKMFIDLTGSGLTDLTINTKKYATLQNLADYLNTQAGFSARVPDPKNKTLPSSVLDMVSNIGILAGQALPSYAGKIKKDYYDWNAYFDNNLVLVDFVEGGMSLKAGLPAAESVPSFLSGGVLGGTTNASIQNVLDAAQRLDVDVVIPGFSRDAFKDIDDGITDESSSYTIDAIIAQVQGHVATASNDINGKYRFGGVSYDGSFANSKLKVTSLGYERMSFSFERHTALNSDGNLVNFLPWIEACAVWSARLQSQLGTPMLRKQFLLSNAYHLGDVSLFESPLGPQNFDVTNRGQVEDAISSGLIVTQLLPGFGVTMISPDLSSRSRENDPQGWVWERISVLYTADSVRKTLESVCQNFVGQRTSDVSEALVRSALQSALDVYLVGSGNGALISASIGDINLFGTTCKAKVSITPTEALEGVILDIKASRTA